MRKSIVLLLVIVFALNLAGCGTGEEENIPQESKSISEIYHQMISDVELPDMIQLDDAYIVNYYGADCNTFDEYVFAAAEDALLAENIIMVKMKEGETTDAIKKLLENLLKQKKAELQDYLPEQYKVVEKSEIVIKGSYIYLIISSQKEALDQIAATYIR